MRGDTGFTCPFCGYGESVWGCGDNWCGYAADTLEHLYAAEGLTWGDP